MLNFMMKFHNIHGTAITLSDGKSVATRADSHFCNGIVFSDQSVKIGQKVCVELTCTLNWSGALRLGFTTTDPSKLTSQDLPKYSMPYLKKKDGYWVRPISESMTSDGTQIMFYLSVGGFVQLFVNNEHKGVILAGLPTDKPLWALLDIYGNTKSLKLVKPDDTPKEINARGPEAVRAFELACTSGMRSVHKTRLMIVGQDHVGKTSLKKNLIGQKHDTIEKETDGIDLSTTCTFTVGSQDAWKVIKGEICKETDEEGTDMQVDADILEEEYNHALATNIIQELLYQKRRKISSTQRPKQPSTGSRESQRSSVSGTKKSLSSKPSSASLSTTKFSEIPTEMFKEVPERVVELVQKMLDSSPEIKSQDSVSMETKSHEGVTMVLNIWDFAGKEAYYTTHNLFLTSRAIYIIVFNLNQDFNDIEVSENESSDLTTLEHIDYWMRSIYAHASEPVKKDQGVTTYSPPILLVGTHKDSLDLDPKLCDKIVEEKFSQIQDFLLGKPYVHHIVTPFFAIENSIDDNKIVDIRQKIEEVACKEPYIGERMPIRWIQFEQEINKLVSQGTNYASYDQLTEIAGNLGIYDHKEIMTMLQFYHDLGVIIFHGSGASVVDNLLRNTVILRPQWLINMFKFVISSTTQPQDKWSLIRDKWTRLQEFGILEETLLDILWCEATDQKLVLLGLLQKFDLVCQRLPTLTESQVGDQINNKSYYVPSRFIVHSETQKLYTPTDTDVTFYIDFHGFLPGGLFHRITTRTCRWSQDQGGQNPYFTYSRVCRFYMDTEHDFVLEMSHRKYARTKVVIMRVAEQEGSDLQQDKDVMSPPNPNICAKVRNFLETMLSELRETWMKRITWTVCVPCPCAYICERHKSEGCQRESCLHFLNLDECLSNKIVMCAHRRIKTASLRKCYPEPLSLGFTGPVLPAISLAESRGNIEKHFPTLPSWVKSAAKLLNSGDLGKDWNALAVELGYKENQINFFNDDLNPGLALLSDWIISSGNTGLSVDMLSVYLEKLDREDIVEMIQKAQETECDPPQVFISYQWDSQDEVKQLRDRLERSGFTCWMDIGQLGGGDQLYTKIDEAIRNSKVVIACVTPKFVISQHCLKELSVADLLRKPIIPVMVDKTVWPPPGGMSLIFSQNVYINMKGIGGHGGTGIHADKNNKYKEIIQRISLYAMPDLTRCTETETDSESKGQVIDNESMNSSFSVLDIEERRSNSTILTAGQRERTAGSGGDRVGSYRSVEQVHVQGCRVCTVL